MRQRGEYWSYECSTCGNDDVWFKQMSYPTGPAKCQSCNTPTTGEEVEERLISNEKQFASLRENRVLRSLGWIGNTQPCKCED